jgi:hypothetical protein
LVVATLLVQTHISYAYVLSVLTLAAVTLHWWMGREVPLRERMRAIRPRSALIGGSVTLALWLPTIGEQFLSSGEGNLSRLASSLGKGELSLGGGNALRASAGVFAWPDWWLRSGFSTTVRFTPLRTGPAGPSIVLQGLPEIIPAAVALLAGTVALVLLSRARGDGATVPGRAACALAAALLPASAVCLAVLTVGPVGLAPHHLRWLWAASVFAHFAAWHELTNRLAGRWSALRPAVSFAPLAAAVLLSAATLPFHAAPEGPVADRAVEANLQVVFRSLEPLRDHQPVRFRTDNLRVYEPYSSAVMMRLQEIGIEFRVQDPGMVRQLGDTRRSDGGETVEVFQLEAADALQYDGAACRLALSSLVTGDEARRAVSSAQWASNALRSGGISLLDDADLESADSALLANAAAGDNDAVADLVYRGHLSRLLSAGVLEVTGADPDQLLDDMRVVDQWVGTTYGLYANLPGSCPHD